MPFCRGNSSYSTDWKGGLLLLTTWVGRPYLAKIWRMALIFESAVVVFMEPITSGHLEWAWPFYYFAWWVAKSTWTRCHGAVGQDHGRSGEAGGALRVLLHGWHSRVTFSISWSIFGHQTWLRAIDFMRVIPGWPSCNSVRMVCLKEGGTLERPHIRQPCSTECSCLRVKYGLSSGSVQWLMGQPFCVRNRAFAKQGVPRCVLGDFCGRNWVSFQLLRGHMEDLNFHTCIFPVLKWEPWQGVSAGYFSRWLELNFVVYKERTRDQRYTLGKKVLKIGQKIEWGR